tara:strand:+ start:6956 stop:7303 length:348 start_codon:yes stop_codon:yes gene_type:complete
MEEIYRNEYGVSYRSFDSNKPKEISVQLIIDRVGLYLSIPELEHLKRIVLNKTIGDPCMCSDCQGKVSNKIWCTNPLIDICFKFNDTNIEEIEDLITGTQFMLDIDKTLKKYALD